METMLDPVALACVSADDVKIPEPPVLLPLGGRKVLLQESQSSGLFFRAGGAKPQKSEQCLRIYSAPRPGKNAFYESRPREEPLPSPPQA
jgi:hypothetical protein